MSYKMVYILRMFTQLVYYLDFYCFIALLNMIKEIGNSLKLYWKIFFLQLMILKESYVFVKFSSVKSFAFSPNEKTMLLWIIPKLMISRYQLLSIINKINISLGILYISLENHVKPCLYTLFMMSYYLHRQRRMQV